MKTVEFKNNVPVAWRLFAKGPLDITRNGKRMKLNITDDKIDSAMGYFNEKGVRVPLDSRHYIYKLAQELGVDEADVVKSMPDGVALLGTGTLEKRGDGLWVSDVQYKPLAQKLAAQGVFEYFSPTIRGLVDGRFRVTSVAMENEPAINHLDSLAAGADDPDDAAESSVKMDALAASAEPINSPNTNKKEASMNKLLQALAGLLGCDSVALGADNDADDGVITKINNAKTELGTLRKGKTETDAFLSASRDALGLGADADLNAVQGHVLSLKAQADQVPALKTRLDAIELSAESDKRAKIIESGKNAGKLTESMMPWAEKQDSAALAAFLEHAPVVVPVDRINRETLPKDDSVALSAEDREVCRLTGTPEEDFLKAKKAK